VDLSTFLTAVLNPYFASHGASSSLFLIYFQD
jgi:hypothetical protein